MEFNHKPVLLKECIEGLEIKPFGTYIDGTMGGAGHSREIYRRLDSRGMLIGIDQDAFAIQSSKAVLEKAGGEAKLIFANVNFKDIKDVCRENNVCCVDGILLDLGVSSHQLDEGERGFSYRIDAPLDMRMDRRGSVTAEFIINEYEENRIRDIIRDYGEERWAARIAAFIVQARKKKAVTTTGELVDIIKAAVPSSARREGPHPAKRTFQAIRIEVNNELGILGAAIRDAVSVLSPGGRLCIITFHSLEDRIVKTEYQKMVKPCTCPPEFPICVCGKEAVARHISKKPILPSEAEIEDNPRARSAKLRIIQRI
ncbi:16S rRNA (cytosine1402-N4)-methyltransferase [Anaerobacterium chartisolvens]|uniref:Ribosomal RNA small subunit methyltransferase H n=1 Tax=Anaerobacterium chartisolvens TaxID=1297424 RepID=A0A369B5H0_9FIRM|nr:16S rRNA (cytosine(1402)-N(4))-methyltransferase RsmH [Anaerobacterium chartisolvens]RCX16565.1 16S rRNA (cytosine1402-N4)-methyltransferase [Anaerobacterium chartisolvens]